MEVEPFVLLIGGPTAAGKTTVADAWAASQRRPTAHVSPDAIRQQVRAGFHDPAKSGWSEETRRQFELAQDLAVLQARRYCAESFNCVIDDAMLPGVKTHRYEHWAEKLADLPHQLVILLPPLDVCHGRNRERAARQRLPDELVARFHRDSQGWLARPGALVIVNSRLTPEAAADEITRLLSELR